MRITKVNPKNSMTMFQITKKMHKDLLEFKSRHGGRMNTIIYGAIVFVASALKRLELRQNGLRELVEYFNENCTKVADDEIKMGIPIDYKVCQKEISQIRTILNTNSDWLAIWFAVDTYTSGMIFNELMKEWVSDERN